MANSNQHCSDQILIKRFQMGDANAVSELICRYQDKVYTTIFYLVKDKVIAEDLFQDTFVKVLSQIPGKNYEEQGKFLQWILRIAHNLCIDYFRRSKQQIKIVFQDGTDVIEFLGQQTDSREKELMKNEMEFTVQKMIQLLPDEQREVVVMRIYGELSFKEIAEITAVSINTALGRMRYALKNLRKMLQTENMVLD